jgi:hypothetical protein
MELTLTVSGSREEIGAAFRGLGEGLLRFEPAPRDGDRGDPWAEDVLSQMWSLITEGARRALKAMSANPGGIERADLMAEVGAPTGSHLAGNLASIGFACNRLKIRTRPYEVDGSVYRMDPKIAGMITGLA